MELPDRNNVYGLIACNQRLPELAKLLRDFLSVGDEEAHLKTSQFDGTQKLLLRTEKVEFDAYPTGQAPGEFLFNGAVAGDEHEVSTFVEELHRLLKNHGFQPRLEVYDDKRQCIAEFDA